MFVNETAASVLRYILVSYKSSGLDSLPIIKMKKKEGGIYLNIGDNAGDA